jgi:hypothetical protein
MHNAQTQNKDLLIVEAGGTHSYRWALKRKEIFREETVIKKSVKRIRKLKTITTTWSSKKNEKRCQKRGKYYHHNHYCSITNVVIAHTLDLWLAANCRVCLRTMLLRNLFNTVSKKKIVVGSMKYG